MRRPTFPYIHQQYLMKRPTIHLIYQQYLYDEKTNLSSYKFDKFTQSFLPKPQSARCSKLKSLACCALPTCSYKKVPGHFQSLEIFWFLQCDTGKFFFELPKEPLCLNIPKSLSVGHEEETQKHDK